MTRPFTPSDTVVYWTTYEYDALGRTTRVIQPDNSVATTYAYTGNTVTVTAPAGRKKVVSIEIFSWPESGTARGWQWGSVCVGFALR